MVPEFALKSREPLELRCHFCERSIRPPFVSEVGSGAYLAADSDAARRIAVADLVLWDSAEQAERAGLVRGA